MYEASGFRYKINLEAKCNVGKIRSRSFLLFVINTKPTEGKHEKTVWINNKNSGEIEKM